MASKIGSLLALPYTEATGRVRQEGGLGDRLSWLAWDQRLPGIRAPSAEIRNVLGNQDASVIYRIVPRGAHLSQASVALSSE